MSDQSNDIKSEKPVQQQQQSSQAPNVSRPAPASRSQQPQYSQQDLNRIVLEYLNKKGYHRSEAMLRSESSNTSTPAVPLPTPSTTDIASPAEFRSRPVREDSRFRDTDQRRKIENDPELYYRAYSILRNWVETSLELYKPELTRILYPIFVQCYLELVSMNFIDQAKEFFLKFKEDHIMLHGLEIKKLSGVSLPEHLKENDLAQAFRTGRYRLIVSKTTINLLLYFLHENEAVGGAVLIRIINQYLNPVIASTRPDKVTKAGEADPEEGLDGYITEANEIDKFNEQSVKLGKMPLEPDVQKEVEAELKVKDEKTEPVDGVTLTEEFQKMTAPDEDAPARESLPLPMKDALDIKRQVLAVEDSRSKIKLGAIQASAPSVCMYTFHNTNKNMTCLNFNDDSTMVAGGFEDSFIKLWSLDGKPLKSAFKKDRYNNDNSRKLIGHSGPVYGLSFSPDNRYLISGSEDKTVRLWSLDSYTALVSYKGHNSPIWDVKFSPLGHYFASASHDQTARLWATDHIYPLRMFAGHINDVDCVEFHPNSNYVFTGSSDKTCRMWDVHSGSSVRIFIGHTGAVNCLAVSPDGRWLASAGEDSVVNIWDIGSGRRLKSMRGHGRSSIYSLSFSREGDVLVSGAADNTVRVWDARKNTNDAGPEPEAFVVDEGATNTSEGTGAKPGEKVNRKEIIATSDQIAAYFTKKTPVYGVHFTRRNLCLAGGAFNG